MELHEGRIMHEGQGPGGDEQDQDPQPSQVNTGVEVPRLDLDEDPPPPPPADDQVAVNDQAAVNDQVAVNDQAAVNDQVAVNDSAGEDPQQGPSRRRRYQRHTADQISELESFFRRCPHPDDRQRKDLSEKVGLRPQQVKFWFQNRRTQSKNHQEREQNNKLRKENDDLRLQNLRFKETLHNPCCRNCGGPSSLGEISSEERQLRIENAHLQSEIERIMALIARHANGAETSTPPVPPPPDPFGDTSFLAEAVGASQNMFEGESSAAAELRGPSVSMQPQVQGTFFENYATLAMDELMMMAHAGEPLWIRGFDGYPEILNEDEYSRAFPRGLGPKLPHLKTEVTRQTALIVRSPLYLVDIIMNVPKWSTFFSGIVSKAQRVDSLAAHAEPSVSVGASRGDRGTMQLVTAEFVVPTPLIPPRESTFLRFCKRHSERVWVIVDVSLKSRDSSATMYRRRPSGCIIQEMLNGYSSVTWVEHVEVDDLGVHNMIKPMVSSGQAFGSRRWLSTLERQCERLTSLSIMSNPRPGFNTNLEGKRNILRLVEKLVVSFCSGVSCSKAHAWSPISGIGIDKDVKVSARRNTVAAAGPPGLILNGSTSFWLPLPPKRVFDFLCSSRNQIFRAPMITDALATGAVIEEAFEVANGIDEGNCISILNIRDQDNPSHVMILQENVSHSSGSYVIYSPLDVIALNAILTGHEIEHVALFPCGFTVFSDLPYGPRDAEAGDGEAGGSILTVSFQMLADSNPQADLPLDGISTLSGLVDLTSDNIKQVLLVD